MDRPWPREVAIILSINRAVGIRVYCRVRIELVVFRARVVSFLGVAKVFISSLIVL